MNIILLFNSFVNYFSEILSNSHISLHVITNIIDSYLRNNMISVEGHISNVYAKYLTSRPHAYSIDSLENTVELLTMKANNITLTEELYHKFKYSNTTYKQLNLEKLISNFKLQTNQAIKPNNKYLDSYNVDNSSFNYKDNYRLGFFLKNIYKLILYFDFLYLFSLF